MEKSNEFLNLKYKQIAINVYKTCNLDKVVLDVPFKTRLSQSKLIRRREKINRYLDWDYCLYLNQ
jgi:hypothetical protein